MAFNVEKCHVVHFGRRNPHHKYSMNSRELEESETEKDVGVLISNDAKPARHIKKAAQTANAVLNQLLKTFHYRDRNVFVRLYSQYVRPHLEFASPAWSPWNLTSDKECLENVQRRAVRSVSGLKGSTY